MSENTVDIERMTVAERLDLIDLLWESVSGAQPELTPEQRDELDRRIDALEKDGPRGVSLQEMWARIERRAS